MKFHWRPRLGIQSTLWDEAVKLQAADNDFHRRDLWEAIESGEYPEWDLAVQLFTEEDAAAFPFDHLDPTKLIPESLVPLRVIGRLVLDRNPDNLFAETELRFLMRPTTDPVVMAGPLFQPIRGLIFGALLFMLRETFFATRWGWLRLWLVLVVVGIIGLIVASAFHRPTFQQAVRMPVLRLN